MAQSTSDIVYKVVRGPDWWDPTPNQSLLVVDEFRFHPEANEKLRDRERRKEAVEVRAHDRRRELSDAPENKRADGSLKHAFNVMIIPQ